MADTVRLLSAERPVPAVPKLAVRELVVARRTASGDLVTATDRLTFEVAAGEFVCLLGPSGCGKTSILNVLAGLDRQTGGEALLDGLPIQGPGPDRAVLFQEPALFPWLSVQANVELALKLLGKDPETRRAEAARWLASALAADPDVLLGDEPFGALDAQARELLQNEVQRVWMQSEGAKTFLFVTHNVREAVVLADRVFVMSAAPGRLLEEFRIHAPRPRDLDDVLVARVVSEIHRLLMQEVDKGVAHEMGD